MKRFAAVILCVFGLILVSCQTNMLKQYEKIQTGMDQSDVLDLMGSPKYSSRVNGQDRWGYVFYHDDQRFEKVVQFENEKVTYVGDVPTPPVPAAEQDKKNEESNAQLEKDLKEEKENLKKDYKKYQDDVKGTGGDIKYVPQFKPL